MRNYDLDFLKKFSMVLGFLAALTLALILFAHYLQGTLPPEQDPAVAKRTLDRIAPAGAVYAGQTGAAAQAAAVAAAAAKAASQVAYGGTLDGAVIFGNLCTGCHTSGAGGAPMMTAAGMGARVAQGQGHAVQARDRRLHRRRRRDAGQGRQPGADRRAGQGHGRLDAGQHQVSGGPRKRGSTAANERRLERRFSFPDFPRRKLALRHHSPP